MRDMDSDRTAPDRRVRGPSSARPVRALVRGRVATALLVLAALLAACGGTTPTPVAPGTGGGAPVELTVFAAASLKGAMEQVSAAYRAAVPGVSLVVSTDSSAALRAKIEQGAPADLFLSADTSNPGALVAAGLAAGDAVPFAGNALAVITPADNPALIVTPADLARPGVKIVAAGENVPITRYAETLVGNLVGLPGYPADFVAAYEANIASREDNVKAIIAKIELGEGDAGIVYATDAMASTKVGTVFVPAAAQVRATYAGVVVAASGHVPEAKALLAWLAGRDGQAILASLGFLPPGP
jgi:molybdate transport system substrate-binding protein